MHICSTWMAAFVLAAVACSLLAGEPSAPEVWLCTGQAFDLIDDEGTRSWTEAALSPLVDDPQIAADERLVDELRRLPVEDLCRFGYEAAKEKTIPERN